MILDEIQTGFGRTGHLFAHKKYNVVPDIMLIGKSMGGGMPISAFVANKELMMSIARKPMLGHITTFGGHPVTVAAALASLKTLLETDIVDQVLSKEAIIRERLKHPIIKEFLFNDRSFRLAPPLIISVQQIHDGCDILLKSMDYALSKYER